MQIHVLKAQGLSLREIARRLGVSRNTVTRHLSDAEVPRYKTRAPRPTSSEPFHDYIRQRMDAALLAFAHLVDRSPLVVTTGYPPAVCVRANVQQP